MINEVDNMTRKKLMSSDYVMICCKSITEHNGTTCYMMQKKVSGATAQRVRDTY